MCRPLIRLKGRLQIREMKKMRKTEEEMRGLKVVGEEEESGEGIKKELEVFLTTEEDGKSGETQKVVIIEDDWKEDEKGEQKVFKVPQKELNKRSHSGSE